MGLLLAVLIGAVVAIIFYVVATTLVTFAHSTLIFGLIALIIFIAIAFSGYNRSQPIP